MGAAVTLRRALRRLRCGRPIVVVSGLPRSGTSMLMRMLAAGGLELVTDGERAADEDNPLGYFELERVKALDRGDAAWVPAARGKAVKVISFLLEKLPRGFDYRVVFLDRALPEVLASQRTMLARRGERSETDDERMAEVFEAHLRKVRRLLREDARFEALEVAYAEVLADPAAQARRIARFLALPLDVDAMAAAVDASLYRNRC